MLMEQEERWMVTDAQVQAVPSVRPCESFYSISECYWSAASRKSERIDSLMRFLRNWTLYQTWNKWYCWLLKNAKSTKCLWQKSCLHSSEGDRILVVLARVLPNFASQTKKTLLRIVMPLRSFRQIIILIMIFFYFLSCAGIYHPANRTLEYFTQCYYEQWSQMQKLPSCWWITKTQILCIPLQWTLSCVDCAALSLLPAVGMLGPRNLRVSDEWYTRFRVSWDPAPSRVNGYKIIYQPEGTDML